MRVSQEEISALGGTSKHACDKEKRNMTRQEQHGTFGLSIRYEPPLPCRNRGGAEHSATSLSLDKRSCSKKLFSVAGTRSSRANQAPSLKEPKVATSTRTLELVDHRAPNGCLRGGLQVESRGV